MLIAVIFGAIVAPIVLYIIIRYTLKFLAGEWDPRRKNHQSGDDENNE